MVPTVNQLHRMTDHHGRTLCFFIRPGSRSRPYKFFEPDQVPEFGGSSAWFEMQRERAGGWVFVRQVERESAPAVGRRGFNVAD